MQTKERIVKISNAVNIWLGNENGILEKSIERTMSEQLFTRHDIDFMLGEIRRTVTPEALEKWAEHAGLSVADQDPGSASQETKNKDVLCLHAGNIPLVGLQDLLATLLAGAGYHGKLSSKDPWLLDGLLTLLQQYFPGQVIRWSRNLDDFNGRPVDRVLFAGSEASVGPVKSRLGELGILKESTRFLERTARFSIAWLDENSTKELQNRKNAGKSKRILNDLVEAMLRYEGKGCRSVAAVVATCGLTEIEKILKPAMQKHLNKNPFLRQENPGRAYWISYLSAIQRGYFECGPILLTDDTDLLGRDDVICWINGNENSIKQLVRQYGSRIQYIYSTGNLSGRSPDNTFGKSPGRSPENSFGRSPDNSPGRSPDNSPGRSPDNSPGRSPCHSPGNSHGNSFNLQIGLLSEAQKPPVYWKPDGVDVLNFLLD